MRCFLCGDEFTAVQIAGAHTPTPTQFKEVVIIAHGSDRRYLHYWCWDSFTTLVRAATAAGAERSG